MVRERAADERRREAASAFMSAWERRDHDSMWALLTDAAKADMDRGAFKRSYVAAERAAGVERVETIAGELRDGAVRFDVRVRTDDFGVLRGVMAVPVEDREGAAGVAWTPDMRLPGLRGDEEPRNRRGRQPERAEILSASGSRLADDPIGAGIAGVPGDGDTPPTGLERLYDDRLAGRAPQRLFFGRRKVARVDGRPGRPVRTTLRLDLSRAAQAALGSDLGGVAVIRPRDGAIVGLGGLAVSAPQPPGSVFKLVTLAAALQHGIVKPSTSFPVRMSATLSGVALRNAGDAPCGGTLAQATANSCNSVFAPLGARLGARRLVAAAERFGFNEQPALPAAKPSTVPAAGELRDDLAVGAAAIGQERDLATPLQMASVAATIANRGVRIRPRIARHEPIVRRRVVRPRVAGQVRDMMVGVVRAGTGTAAAIPGVSVAGKTGTAELRPTADGPQDPRNTNAWFVAFAPADGPRIAVAVMLVGAGQGGTRAAPVARQVLQAAL